MTDEVRQRVVALIGAFLCALALGCQDVATTWSATAPSPDGRWIAVAQTQQWGGPGTAYDATTVSISQSNQVSRFSEVLGLSHQFGTINLKMEWTTPSDLKITYASNRPNDTITVDFQAVKYQGVDIDVQRGPGVVETPAPRSN